MSKDKEYLIKKDELSAYLAKHSLWLTVYQNLGVSIPNAIDKFSPGKKNGGTDYCPLHGGKSGEAFGLFKDADQTGGCFCNSCGYFQSGYSFLMELYGWTFREMLEQVAIASGYMDGLETGEFKAPPPDPERERLRREREQQEKEQSVKLRAEVKALWTEAHKLNTKEAAPARLYLEKRGITIPLSFFGTRCAITRGSTIGIRIRARKKPCITVNFPHYCPPFGIPRGSRATCTRPLSP